MKILFCDNSLRELLNFRWKIIESYLSDGCEVVLVAPKNCEHLSSSPLLKFIPVTMSRSGKNPIQDLKYWNTLRQIYRREKPDYIFHYTIKPNIYGSLAAKVSAIHSTAMVAGLGYVFANGGFSNNIARRLYKWALKFVDHVFVLNYYNFEYLRNSKFVLPGKLLWLKGGEGVDLEYFKVQYNPVLKDKICFLMVGRVLYDKGYQEYVDTAKVIKNKKKNVAFQLLGGVDSAYPDYVSEQQINKDVTDGYIQYLGYQKDVIEYMEQADCIVLPSYHEGLSRVLMEALAMGKPIITTNIPGCRETVESGRNGYLVEPKSADSLTEAVKKFLSLDGEERKRMGLYSRKKAEREFDINAVIFEYKKITDKYER